MRASRSLYGGTGLPPLTATAWQQLSRSRNYDIQLVKSKVIMYLQTYR
nr:MAG TPA: hypothetical protein [Caudoviricetes sp.]